VYLAAKLKGGNLPIGISTSDKCRGNLVVKWFDCMATEQERTQLGPVRQGEEPTSAGLRKRPMNLQVLIICRLREAFAEKNIGTQRHIPPALREGQTSLKAGAIETRISELKSAVPRKSASKSKKGAAEAQEGAIKSVEVEVTKEAFAAFRQRKEAKSRRVHKSSSKENARSIKIHGHGFGLCALCVSLSINKIL
jgi:hypothetical protein